MYLNRLLRVFSMLTLQSVSLITELVSGGLLNGCKKQTDKTEEGILKSLLWYSHGRRKGGIELL